MNADEQAKMQAGSLTPWRLARKPVRLDAQCARQHFRRVVCELAPGQTNAAGKAALARALKLADSQ